VAASEVTTVHLGMSISIMDEEFQQTVEPGTATTTARLASLRAIRDAGLPCTVFLSPILPLLTDSRAALAELLGAVAAAGATSVLYTPLYLATGVKEIYFGWLREAHPELLDRYAKIYAADSETPRVYRDWLAARIRPLIAGHGCRPRSPTHAPRPSRPPPSRCP
jgi:DNA repair photolyase